MTKVLFFFLSCQVALYAHSACFTFDEPRKPVEKDLVPSRHALKINLTPLFFKTLSLQYEHAIHRKVSLAFQYNRMFLHKLPFIRFKDPNRTDPTIEGYSLTPEIRFYPWGKASKPAPDGFYFGAYLRYAKRYIRWDRFEPSFTINNSITYTAYTYGVFLGKHWIVGKHFSIDWCIAGIGYGFSKIQGGFNIPYIDLPDEVQEVLQNEYVASFDGFLARTFGFKGAQVNTTKNSLNVTMRNVPTYSFRLMGLSVGYAF